MDYGIFLQVNDLPQIMHDTSNEKEANKFCKISCDVASYSLGLINMLKMVNSPLLALKSNRNLLVRSRLPPTSDTNTLEPTTLNLETKDHTPGKVISKQTTCSCFLHKILDNSPIVTSSVTHRSYIIRDQLDCSDRNIIYLITCDKCHLQYVGYTKETLRYQIAQHVRSIHLAKTQEQEGNHRKEYLYHLIHMLHHMTIPQNMILILVLIIHVWYWYILTFKYTSQWASDHFLSGQVFWRQLNIGRPGYQIE